MESVFFSAMVYFEKIKTSFQIKSSDFKQKFCDNVKKEMEIVINKELSTLEKGLKFSCISWVNSSIHRTFELCGA